MNELFEEIQRQVAAIQHWFWWVAIALGILVVVNLVVGGFLIWGVLRIVRLSEINQFPRNPAKPEQAFLFGGPRP